MDLETITVVGSTLALVGGGAYGVRTFFPKFASAYIADLGYAIGEGIGQGIAMGVTKAFTGEELDPSVFDTAETRAKRWSYQRPVLTSYLGLSASSLALCLGVCSGIPTSLLELMSS